MSGFLDGATECIWWCNRPACCGVERSRRDPISRHSGRGITHRGGSNGTDGAVVADVGSTGTGISEHGPGSHTGNGHRRWFALVKRSHHSGNTAAGCENTKNCEGFVSVKTRQINAQCDFVYEFLDSTKATALLKIATT